MAEGVNKLGPMQMAKFCGVILLIADLADTSTQRSSNQKKIDFCGSGKVAKMVIAASSYRRD